MQNALTLETGLLNKLALKMNKIRKSAFSLIELSIVLVIISIIIAGTLSASTVSINNSKIKVTNDRMKAIYQALGNYMVTNYKLPCPAPLTLARDSSGYGSAVGTAGSCAGGAGTLSSNTQSAIYYGMVPFATLGLPTDMGEDGFGNKMIYIVSSPFTDADYPSTTLGNKFSSYVESNNSTIRILQVATNNTLDGNIFALLSLGQNKYGAFSAKSTAQNSDTSSDSYEQQNYVSSVNMGAHTANFGNITGHANKVVITYSNPNSDIFDDIVFAKTRSQMVIDFNAMFLIPCAASGSYGTAYHDQISYSTSNCTTPNDVRPSKRCVGYGVWATEQSCFVD